MDDGLGEWMTEVLGSVGMGFATRNVEEAVDPEGYAGKGFATRNIEVLRGLGDSKGSRGLNFETWSLNKIKTSIQTSFVVITITCDKQYN
jgi:hypothetical protein